MKKILIPAIALLMTTAFTAPHIAAAQTLEKIAEFQHQVTGVAITRDNRIFVNFPRWTEDSPISVAEVMKDGSLKPYPDAAWNEWRNVKKDKVSPKDHWVCVQSVVAGPNDTLWVVDPAAPATEKIVKGGPKLVEIDLKTNQPKRTIPLDDTIAPPGAYINDIRFSPDGRFAYLTDSGRGALITVNLENNTAHRVLDGDKHTMPEKNVVVMVDGKPLRKPDGRQPEFASDGIAVSPDGQYVYWQALTGKTLYRLPSSVLNDFTKSDDEIVKAIEKVGDNGPSDGFWMDKDGRLYFGSPEENAIKVRDGEKVSTIIKDDRLRWPDSFAQGSDGKLYVTSSRIQDSAMIDPKAPPQLQTQLWRINR